ncbi:DUF4197 domain-containing protein [Thiomonas intermedia]|uniref:DUF4197 domain-containing protein n=1 Tax=Thiomonas intermedia TaxID=926 RepID=UPI0009A4C7EC|nr:DUF4197 domain-containing protein [Thiomonas intermedia]
MKTRRLVLAALLTAAAPLPASAFDLGNLTNQLSGALGTAQAPAQQAAQPHSGGGDSSGATNAAIAALSSGEVDQGLKTALSRGADIAVKELGRENGFYGNAKWRIPLPPAIEKASGLMRMAGLGAQADQLDLAINRAAEAAVPEAKTLLVNAVKTMSVQDAKGILTGGDEAATDYFKRKTEAPLTQKFLPIVTRATDQVGLAQTYNRFAGQAAQFGLVKADQASIQSYVTQQALDRLYQAIGEQEKAIRADPVGTGSKLLGKVFGAALGQ